jgi:hypothetical protein
MFICLPMSFSRDLFCICRFALEYKCMILLTTFFLPCLFQFLEMVWDKKVGDVLQLFVV